MLALPSKGGKPKRGSGKSSTPLTLQIFGVNWTLAGVSAEHPNGFIDMNRRTIYEGTNTTPSQLAIFVSIAAELTVQDAMDPDDFQWMTRTIRREHQIESEGTDSPPSGAEQQRHLAMLLAVSQKMHVVASHVSGLTDCLPSIHWVDEVATRNFVQTINRASEQADKMLLCTIGNMAAIEAVAAEKALTGGASCAPVAPAQKQS